MSYTTWVLAPSGIDVQGNTVNIACYVSIMGCPLQVVVPVQVCRLAKAQNTAGVVCMACLLPGLEVTSAPWEGCAGSAAYAVREVQALDLYQVCSNIPSSS
jgi:hypothetical protein